MSESQPRRMAMVAFLQAQNCSNYAASWRHPATAGDFMSAGYYTRIARTLEDGRFDLAFFDDRLAMPDRYGDSYAETVRHGIRTVKLDLVPILAIMGAATRHLGLGGTYSTTYYEPFHVARVFATLDAMTEGRAAWNIVTSLNDSEGANFSQTEHLDHDLRYDRAEEFMEVVLGHWDTWEDDAIRLDKAGDVFADPAKVHRLSHEGRWFRSRGPFTVPRSAQGHPVLIQAGQSGRGQQFAARWADLVFVIYPSLDYAQSSYAAFKRVVAAGGRDPALVRVAPAIYPVVGETRGIARERADMVAALVTPMDSLVLLSEVLNYDFSKKALDEPFTDAEMAGIGGLQAIRDRVTRLSGNPNPTLRDFVQYSGRGTVKELPNFVGTAHDIADEMEAWFNGGACDGFVVAATHMPGTYEEFVRLVVPELQRRGLMRREYEGTTLRDNLGLARPARGDWRM